MKKIIIILGLILTIAMVNGCAQQQTPEEQPPSTTIEFTFANEATVDTTLTAFINDEKVYEKELISATTAGGYFGQEFEYKILEVPDQEFTLKITESATGFEESTQINPVDGKFVAVTFWGDKFMIQQTEEKQIRID